MARKTEPKVSKAPLVVGILGLALVGTLAAYIVNSPGRVVDEPAQSRGASNSKPADVKVYTPSYEKGELKLKSTSTKPVEKQDPHVLAVNSFLEQLKMVPKDARLLSCKVSEGTATLDFSPAFETTYGTEDEQTVLKGVLTTMGQFDDVKGVRFTVAGRGLETLGNVDLTQPQEVLRESGSSGR